MFPLVFLVLIFFAQYFTISETEIAQKENSGKTILAPPPPGDSQAVFLAAQFALRDLAEPSFKRSSSSCQATERNGEDGPLEMSLLHETCQGQVSSVRGLLAILGTMPRFQLCASIQDFGLHWWLARPGVVGSGTMGCESTQVAQKAHTEPRTQSQATQCGGGQRQTQRGRKRFP